MYILFIVTSFWAYGELTIACEFAKGLKNKNIHPYFLVPPTHKSIMQKSGFPFMTLIPKNGKINRILMQDIEIRYHPKLVILADFLNYNFCEEHYGLKPEDLSIFSGRHGTFDDFDWAVTGKHMDTYGFQSKKFAGIDILKYGFRLCPCPVVNPCKRDRKDAFPYALSTKKIPYNEQETENYKKKLSLDPKRKLIVFTSATWQEHYKQYPDIISFVKLNNELLRIVMEELAKDCTILCVGEEGYFSETKVPNMIFREHMHPDEFQEYLLASDLFMSRNIVSTSLARAVLSGIPAVNFQNSHPSYDELSVTEELMDQVAEAKRCYKYRMFPVGWHTFLEPLCSQNPYLDTFLNLEQFDVKESIHAIRELLESLELRRNLRKKVSDYEDELKKLMTVDEIVECLVDGREQ